MKAPIAHVSQGDKPAGRQLRERKTFPLPTHAKPHYREAVRWQTGRRSLQVPPPDLTARGTPAILTTQMG